MTRNVLPVGTGDDAFLVEVVPIKEKADNKVRRGRRGDDLARGPVSVPESTYDQLKGMISGLAGSLRDAVDQGTADELSIEAKIAFGGKATAVPFLASVESDASLTVKIMWRKAARR